MINVLIRQILIKCQICDFDKPADAITIINETDKDFIVFGR